MLFGVGAGTPGNFKVMAGDCQRLLEIVDNSTFNKNYNSHKKLPNQKLLLFGVFGGNAFFNENMYFLGRRKYH